MSEFRFDLRSLLLAIAFVAFVISTILAIAIGQHVAGVRAIAFSSDGSKLCFSMIDKRLTTIFRRSEYSRSIVEMSVIDRSVSVLQSDAPSPFTITHNNLPADVAYLGSSVVVFDQENSRLTIRSDRETKTLDGVIAFAVSDDKELILLDKLDCVELIDWRTNRCTWRLQKTVPSPAGFMLATGVSNSADRVAITNNGETSVLRLADNNRLFTLPSPASVVVLLQNSDIVIVGTFRRSVQQFANGQTLELADTWDGLSYSPSTQQLAIAGPSGLHIYGIQENALPELHATLPFDSQCVAFSPDGRFLAIGERPGMLSLIDVESRQKVWSVNLPVQSYSWRIPLGVISSIGFVLFLQARIKRVRKGATHESRISGEKT